jgi:hypothetical protein
MSDIEKLLKRHKKYGEYYYNTYGRIGGILYKAMRKLKHPTRLGKYISDK